MEEKSTIRRIWDFAKDHQTITIAVVSGIIAITTFLLKNSIYMNTKLFLSYFGINSNGIIDINDKQLYGTIWSLIVQVYFVFVCFFNEDISNKYAYEKDHFKRMNKAIKSINKFESTNKKRAITNLSNIKLTRDERIEEFDRLSWSNYALSKAKEYKKDLRLTKRNYGKYTAFYLFIVVTLSFIVSFPYATIASSSGKGTFMLAVIFAIMPILMLLFECVLTRFKYKSKIKHPQNKGSGDIDNDTEKAKELILFRVLDKGFIETVKDFDFPRLVFTLAFSLLFFIILTTSTGYSSAKYTKEFSVFEDNGYSYAVIYENSESIIAEKVEINNKKATIHKNEQITKSKKDIPFTVVKFETIDLVDN